MKNIALLGSTGSIGNQVLDVVSRLPNKLKVVSLAGHRNVNLLAEQIKSFRPMAVSVGTQKAVSQLREMLADLRLWPPLELLGGTDGLKRAATVQEADMVVVAVAGSVGLAPTIAAISAGKDIALATKEVLVAAGHIITKLAQEKDVQLLPIDSEHSAIFQCLQGQDKRSVRQLTLTASGGALANYPVEDLGRVTVEQALAHPIWRMGRKITVDSATLMNKALEIIEAAWLFGVEPSRIRVVIHPQSIVHSMVEFEDGSIIAQMGVPDMRLPIQYALLYPERLDTGLPRLDLTTKSPLTFARPDPERYPGLALGYRAAEQGGTMPAVLNASNEVAVALFLEKKIGFLDICRTVLLVMESHKPILDPDLDQILEADSWARKTSLEITERTVV